MGDKYEGYFVFVFNFLFNFCIRKIFIKIFRETMNFMQVLNKMIKYIF